MNRHDEKLAQKASARFTTSLVMSLFVIGISIATAVWYCPVDPIAFTAKPLPEVKWDDRLSSQATVIQLDDVRGPATLAFKNYDGKVTDVLEGVDGEEENVAPKKGTYLYTSGTDGKIVEIEMATGSKKILVNISEERRYLAHNYKCGQHKEIEDMCGRTMGMAFDQDNLRLYILNAYKGLYALDIESKVLEKMTDEDENGAKYHFLYGLAVSRHSGIIYFTEAHTLKGRPYMRAGVLEGAPNGRLLSFNPTDGTVRMLASKMYFPTGVLIQENKEGTADEAILVAETSRARIRKVPIWKDPNKKATPTTFAENLPGLPMSLQWANSDRKEIIVGCEARESWIDYLSKYPKVRAFIAAVQGWMYDTILPRRGIVVRLDQKGAIVGKVLQDAAVTKSMTSAQIFDGALYIANDGFSTDSIAKLDKFK